MSAFNLFTTTSITVNFGRSGYNGPEKDDDDNNKGTMVNMGRGGYNAPVICFGGDDDDKDQGRSGYN